MSEAADTRADEAEQQDEEAQTQAVYYDAPNQQVVREDGSGPWDEGTGGTPGAGARDESVQGETTELDTMTKDELLTHARSLGVSPANATMTKDELRESIDAHNKQEEEAAE